MFFHLFLVALVISSSYAKATADTAVKPELQETVVTALASRPETIESTTPEPEPQASIIITNAIQPSMLAYKHWTGTYNPDKFTITVNDIEVAQGAQHTLSATTDPIDIRFDYSFVNGKRTGSHVISYQLDENIAQANITFSWNDEWKVIVDNGKPVKHEEIKT